MTSPVSNTRDQRKSAYVDAGVDLAFARQAIAKIRTAIESTETSLTLGTFGAFGGAIRIPSGFKEPALVASIDGVGTKLHLAIDWGRASTAGHDLVTHCLNDIAVQNAHPLAFLDYVAADHMDADVLVSLVEGMATACQAANVSLVGGETALMPDTYAPGRYDTVGVALGIAEAGQIPDPASVTLGDICIGIPSNGLHTNGYSLARKLVEVVDSTTVIAEQTVEAALLAPHRSYVTAVLTALAMPGVRIAAHITGGGIAENLARVLPDTVTASIDTELLPQLPIFDSIAEALNVQNDEMFRVFNMGVGMILVVEPRTVEALCRQLHDALPIGQIIKRNESPVELSGVS